MPVVSSTPEQIERAAALLRNGGVIAFPTETVYGLGANAFDARAVARIFEIKRRPSFDPLIVHVADDAILGRVTRNLPDSARLLMRRFWPGPLTLVLERGDEIPLIVTSGMETVAVRMPSHPVAMTLLRSAGIPIAAPSANPFGALSPTRASHVIRAIGDQVDLILDDGPTPLGIESTVVQLEPKPQLLRPGALPVEEIENVIGTIERDSGIEDRPRAPGRLASHYAPRAPLRIVSSPPAEAQRADCGFLGFTDAPQGYAAVRILSERGDLREAAARLFEALHDLDELGLRRIDVQRMPEAGLGLAIMDRLSRAANGG